MKEKVFKEEMKGFNISIDDIEPSDDIFGAIEKTIIKMRNDYLINRLEVILNDNLIECKDKLTNFRTILGCRVSYDNLPKDVSFIVREDEKPTYEKLEEKIQGLNNIIEELEWKPIEEYFKNKENYDWVLVKYYDKYNFECIPSVAEYRFGKWYLKDNEKTLQDFEVRYFFDMQQLDKLKELLRV